MRTISSRFARLLFGGCAWLLLPALANAATWYPNQPITNMGVHPGTAYFFFASSGSCAIWYFAEGTPAYNSATHVNRGLAILTAAYLSGKNVTRIDYEQNGTACYASLVQF